MSKQRTTRLALAMAITLSSGATLATSPATSHTPEEYESRIQKAMIDSKTLAASAHAGKRAAFLCLYCHGEDGSSVQENIPNLAGQNPVYLLTQIEKFGDGRRSNEFMSGLIKSLKVEDRVSIAVYYSTMRPNTPAATDANLIEHGKKRYQATCIGCHGPKANGTKAIARLAGQRVSYLTEALANYRASKSPRTDPVMTTVARNLAPEDIPAIAAYLSTLK